jgi:hypothetical protein
MHLLAVAAQYRAGHGGWYLLFRWLWQQLGWWAVPVCIAIPVLAGFIRGFIGFLTGADD